MKLKKVELTQFRCFEHVSVQLRPDVTVIVGANAAGKTSILDGIALGLQQFVQILGGLSKKKARTGVTSLQPSDIMVTSTSKDQVKARKDFVLLRVEANDYYGVENFPTKTESGELRALEWADYLRFTPPNRFTQDSKGSTGMPELRGYFSALWGEVRKSSPTTLIPFPVVGYYRASRRVEGMPHLGNILSVNPSRSDAYQGALNAGANFGSMCQWFYVRENDELRKRAKKAQGENVEFMDLKAARAAIKATMPRVESVYFDGNPPKLTVDFSQQDGTAKPLELEELSDGYRSMLAMVLDFARRLALAHPNWPNPLEAPGILMIDEIELHLHPRWQQEVIPSLRRVFPNTQLILTTHSPQVLSTVQREHILVLGSEHRLESLPPTVGTYGAENSRVIAEVLGVSPRPQNVNTVALLSKYLAMVEEDKAESKKGLQLRKELDDQLGKFDPDLMAADLRIDQRKASGDE
ncbi:hypothetical protein PLCT2_00548 [Planctomycetaceae bacterium]|nr:hypothetical protein PLCT2_00548 [Planctomycetaceae bacterium]